MQIRRVLICIPDNSEGEISLLKALLKVCRERFIDTNLPVSQGPLLHFEKTVHRILVCVQYTGCGFNGFG